jgi:hypothetical protein
MLTGFNPAAYYGDVVSMRLQLLAESDEEEGGRRRGGGLIKKTTVVRQVARPRKVDDATLRHYQERTHALEKEIRRLRALLKSMQPQSTQPAVAMPSAEFQREYWARFNALTEAKLGKDKVDG